MPKKKILNKKKRYFLVAGKKNKEDNILQFCLNKKR